MLAGPDMCPAVLVVEDDVATRTLLSLVMSRAGFEVDAIGSGADAITLLSFVRYSALICDLHLPGTSGHDVLAYLEVADPDMLAHTVVVSSTQRLEIERVRTRYTSTQVFRKPFDLEQLTRAVVEATKGHPEGPRDVASEFCRQSIVCGAKAGVVFVKDAKEEKLNLVHSFGYSPEMIERFVSLSTDAPFPAAVAYRSASPVWVNSPDVLAAHYPALDKLWRDTRSYALAALPLLRDGVVFGAAGWSFREPRSFTEDERRRLEAIAVGLANDFRSAVVS